MQSPRSPAAPSLENSNFRKRLEQNSLWAYRSSCPSDLPCSVRAHLTAILGGAKAFPVFLRAVQVPKLLVK
jgi:hypothetical protein